MQIQFNYEDVTKLKLIQESKWLSELIDMFGIGLDAPVYTFLFPSEVIWLVSNYI